MSENTKADIEENGTEDSENTEPSGAEVREEETEEEASAELEDLKKKNKDFRRRLADVDNYKKRLEKENQDSFDLEKRQMLEKLLPVLDSFEKAIKDFRSHSEREKYLLDGIKDMRKQVFTVLQELDVTEIKIPSDGESAFDPSYHEAVHKQYSKTHKSGTIISEFRKGYLLNGRLLRASMVSVSQGPEEKEPEKDSEDKTV